MPARSRAAGPINRPTMLAVLPLASCIAPLHPAMQPILPKLDVIEPLLANSAEPAVKVLLPASLLSNRTEGDIQTVAVGVVGKIHTEIASDVVGCANCNGMPLIAEHWRGGCEHVVLQCRI